MFKVGDRVKCVSGYSEYWYGGREFIITKINGVFLYNGDGTANCFKSDCELIKEKPMTLRQRIEALDNGWDKEADDILQEIYDAGCYWIDIRINMDSGGGFITIHRKVDSPRFAYGSQCSKNQAFKDALLWLLDKSGLDSAKEGDKAEVEIEGHKWEAKLVRKL